VCAGVGELGGGGGEVGGGTRNRVEGVRLGRKGKGGVWGHVKVRR